MCSKSRVIIDYSSCLVLSCQACAAVLSTMLALAVLLAGKEASVCVCVCVWERERKRANTT
jgi:hypothetical protein